MTGLPAAIASTATSPNISSDVTDGTGHYSFTDLLPSTEYTIKFIKPDGTTFYAVTVETDDSINLVKIKVKTDDAEALERWLEGEEDAENEDVAGSSADAPADSTLPDDNISQYGGDDDSAE